LISIIAEHTDLIISFNVVATKAYDLFIIIYPGEYINSKK